MLPAECYNAIMFAVRITAQESRKGNVENGSYKEILRDVRGEINQILDTL